MEILDNPAWLALSGPHSSFAQGGGRGRRYRPDVSDFSACENVQDPHAWHDVGAAVGPEGVMLVAHRERAAPPDGFAIVFHNAGVQQALLAPAPDIAVDLDVTELGDDDVRAMLDLVAETHPGPFSERTIELGGYVGAWVGDRLVAMAGRRFATDDAVEISGVCTAADHRGRGLAAALTARVAAEIQAEGRVPFLHTIDTNAAARRVYAALGFAETGTMHFVAVTRTG